VSSPQVSRKSQACLVHPGVDARVEVDDHATAPVVGERDYFAVGVRKGERPGALSPAQGVRCQQGAGLSVHRQVG